MLRIMVASKKPPAPTAEQFRAYQAMYRHFNRTLFGGKLPPILLNFSRHANTLGFFAPDRWEAISGGRLPHEISLNPAHLKGRPSRETASTLVHEMAHLWQQEFGSPSRTGYHNREWADKMETIGLMPSATGLAGGNRVGQSMTHYIVARGAFDKAFKKMPKPCLLPWQSGEGSMRRRPPGGPGGEGAEGGEGEGSSPAGPVQSRNKVKYTCGGDCGVNVWGKPDLNLLCGDCDEAFAVA